MKVIVLGAGKIGSVIAEDFSNTGAQIASGDIDLNRAKSISKKVGGDALVFDTSAFSSMVKTLSEYDLVLGALPGDYGYRALEASIEAKKSVVDVSFTPENPMALDKAARNAGVTIITDCGVAPGLSNLLVGYGASKLEKVEEAKIMVGGIPEHRVPPLDYTVTWSTDGLIDEYIRDVSIVKGGKVVQVPALSGLENIEFPGVGTLEAFYTDGLRTLVNSFPDITNLSEKTLRYPGHVEKLILLKELGFFSEDPIMIQGIEIIPKFVSARVFEKSLTMPEVGDLLAMMVEVSGEKDGKRKRYRYTVLEYIDHDTGVSAMARTTAYTASIVAKILIDGRIQKKGVVPMEKLGSDHRFVRTVFEELGKRNVEIKETENK